MIRLLILVVVLALAIGVGIGGLIHFQMIPDFTGMIAPPTEEQAVEAEPPPPPRIDPVLIDMKPMLVPVIRDRQVQRNIYIAFRLEVEPDRRDTLMGYLPQLQDVYLRALFEMVPKQLEKRQTLDLPKIKERLKVITDRVTGEGVVRDIVVSAVFDR